LRYKLLSHTCSFCINPYKIYGVYMLYMFGSDRVIQSNIENGIN